MRPRLKLAALLGAAGSVLASCPAARATDAQLVAAAGPTAYASTWRGDAGAGGTLRAGARFGRIVQPDFQVWESYATVNERVNTGLSLGVTAFVPISPVQPYLRIFALHQHEEGLVSVVATPGGFLFGIGSGIRHRAGGGATLGVEVPFHVTASGRLKSIAFAEVTGTYFPDATLGPSAYVGLSLGLGLDYLLR